jgi:hypothetical protein
VRDADDLQTQNDQQLRCSICDPRFVLAVILVNSDNRLIVEFDDMSPNIPRLLLITLSHEILINSDIIMKVIIQPVSSKYGGH